MLDESITIGTERLLVALGQLAKELRQYWSTSQHAKWMPPKQRGKSRFMNVFPLIKWAEKMLGKAQSMPQEVRERTAWIFHNRAFVESLGLLRRSIAQVMKLLKREGACASSLQKAQGFLPPVASPLIESIHAQTRLCLSGLKDKAQGNCQPFLCCSGIIETLFGKFKYRLGAKQKAEITNMALSIPFFCGATDRAEVKLALESVRNAQVKNWKNEQAQQNRAKTKN